MKVHAIFSLKPGIPLEGLQELFLAEERMAWKFFTEDFLREIYLTDKPGVVIAVVESESIEAARRRFDDLPMMIAGAIDIELHQLKPFANWALATKQEGSH